MLESRIKTWTACVIALALSLTLTSFGVETFKADKYKYFIPVNTNYIKGVVMGENGDYSSVRYEDIAWLRNALTERYWWLSRNIRTASFEDNAYRKFNTETNLAWKNKHCSALTIQNPTRLFSQDGLEINWGGLGTVVFSNPLNEYSHSSRMIETGHVISTEMTYSNVTYTVVTNLTRQLDTRVSVVTNTYRSSSNVYYTVETTNELRVTDFCFEDVEMERVFFDVGEFYSFVVGDVMSKYIITNLFGWLKNAGDIGVVQELQVAKTIHTYTDTRYSSRQSRDVTKYRNRDPITTEDPYKESETNYTYTVTNFPIVVEIGNTAHQDKNEFWGYSKDDDDQLQLDMSSIYESSSKSANKTTVGKTYFYIKTPVTTNEYALLKNRLPIDSLKCYALVSTTVSKMVDSSWSESSDNNSHSTNESVSATERYMIPIGDTNDVYIPNGHNEGGNICFKLAAESLGDKMKETISSTTNRVSVEYRTFPSFTLHREGEVTPLDSSHDCHKYYDDDANNGARVKVEKIYGLFFYDFETKLEHWTKQE